jgi:hypothetical protein
LKSQFDSRSAAEPQGNQYRRSRAAGFFVVGLTPPGPPDLLLVEIFPGKEEREEEYIRSFICGAQKDHGFIRLTK